MKHIPGLLLLATALLSSVYSIPTDNGKPYPFDPDHPTEYSLEELKIYFDEKESDFSSKSKRKVDRTLHTEVDEVSSPTRQSLAVKNINLSQSVLLKYTAICSATDIIQDNFTFTILYNGQDVTFHKGPTSNIDSWGKVYVDPIHPNRPIFAEVSFRHALCKPITRHKVCTYYFTGIARANIIYYGKNPGITPDAVQPDVSPNEVYVTVDCNETPGPNGRIGCPENIGAVVCHLNDIFVIKAT